MHEVKLPFLAEGVSKATVSYWHKQPGDGVKSGEDLVELITDKAAFNMPAPVEGKLKEILAPEGSVVSVGQIVAIIE